MNHLVFSLRFSHVVALLLVLAVNEAVTVAATPAQLCVAGPGNTFTVKVDLFASEYGYFQIEECGDVLNPTLGVEIGQTYRFVQNDVSNLKHPLGISHMPGHGPGQHQLHGGAPPGTIMGYYIAGERAGMCTATAATSDGVEMMMDHGGMHRQRRNVMETDMENDEHSGMQNMDGDDNGMDMGHGSSENHDMNMGPDTSGIDHYYSVFGLPLNEWREWGPFMVELTITPEIVSASGDLFYHCHMHSGMVGRIKVLSYGQLVHPENSPQLGFEYQTPAPFDQACGTFGLANFALPHDSCPSAFVCDKESAPTGLRQFSDCIDAMNCHMLAGMTTGVTAGSEIALFMHQMIPHHQNAVNMAKAMLYTDLLPCDDLSDTTNPYCESQVLMREIIAGQNAQIEQMLGILDKLGFPETDDCEVEIVQSHIVRF